MVHVDIPFLFFFNDIVGLSYILCNLLLNLSVGSVAVIVKSLVLVNSCIL
jgi:hypothetical protein